MNAPTNNPTIVAVGECTLDDYVLQGETHVGGIALNFAVHAARCGARASLVSRVGNDGLAGVRTALTANGVSDEHLVTDHSAPTARQRIHILPDGERSFPAGGFTFGSMQGFLPDAQAAAHIAIQDAVACPCYTQALPLFNHVMRLPITGLRIADFSDLSDFGRDPGVVARHAPALAVAFVGGDNAHEPALQEIARAGNCVIVLTLGAQGSIGFEHEARHVQPAVAVERTVDTTGCGDAFQAAFIVSWLRQRNVPAALAAGAAHAATVARHRGAF